jgi:transposase-like protein
VACDKDYTPDPKPQGYPPQTRKQALALVLEGMSLRAAARTVGVNPQSVANWLAGAQTHLQQQGQSSLPATGAVTAETVELDEVHVFVGARKGEKNAGSTSPRP